MALERQEKGRAFNPHAATWNAFCDTAEAGEVSDLSGVDKNSGTKNTCIIWIKNTSGVARDRFDVLKLDDPLITPAENENEFKNRVAFKAVALDDAAAATPVILLQPLSVNGCGRGVVLGATIAYVEVIDENHEYAKYSSDHPEYLESTDESGPIKLIYNPGIGADLAIVLIGAGGGGTSTTHAFKYVMLLENLLANGGPVRGRVLQRPGNTPTSEVISVYDAVLASGSYAGGSTVKADLDPDDGKYYISGSACTVAMSTP